MNKSLLSIVTRILSKNSDIFIYDMSTKKFDISDNYNELKKRINVSSYIQNNIPDIPKDLKNLLLKQLKDIREKTNKLKIEYSDAKLRMKNLFIYIFVELVRGYEKYIDMFDNYISFNSVLFVKEKGYDKIFYENFSSTLMFRYFSQSYFTDNKKTYFQQRLSDRLLTKNGLPDITESFEKFKSFYNENFKIEKEYLIKPDIIKDDKEHENTLSLKNKIDINKFLSNCYKDNWVNLFSMKRVIEKTMKIPPDKLLSNDNDPENIDFYILPDQDNKILLTNEKNNNNEKLTECSQIIPNYGLSENEMYSIRNDIKESMGIIYSSFVEKIEQAKDIKNLMNNRFAREYFISIVFTDKIKYFTEEFYDLMNSIIDELLQNIKDQKEILSAVKVIKGCVNIKKFKKKKEISLSDDLYKKLGVKEYSFIKDQKFWETWVEVEMSNLKKHLGESYNEQQEKNKFINSTLQPIMKEMKFKQEFIENILTNLNKKYIC